MPNDRQLSPLNRQRLFAQHEPPVVNFPIQTVDIDWVRLEAKRPMVLDTVDEMPAYLLKPEVLGLIAQEPDPALLCCWT